MAMNGNTLGNKIADDVLAISGDDLSAGEKTTVRSFWILVASDMTDHIDINAEITPGSFTAGGDAVTGEGDIQ